MDLRFWKILALFVIVPIAGLVVAIIDAIVDGWRYISGRDPL